MKQDNRLKTLIVEDDPEVVREFEMFIRATERFVLTGSTGRQDDAIAILRRESIDVVILDLELEFGDGISFLEDVRERLHKSPFIIAVTNNRSEAILQCARENGVDFVCPKANEDYSPERILDFIDKTYRFHKKVQKKEKRAKEIHYDQKRQDEYTREVIRDILHEIGFKISAVGTRYLVEAIFVAMGKGDVFKIYKDIYPEVAKIFETKTENVERSIRFAIETTWDHVKVYQLEKYYPFEVDNDTGRPTNSEFIYNIARRVKRP